MADDKNGRDAQAHDAERRQRERELAEALERAEEPEPPAEELLAPLEPVSFPATGAEVVAAVGDHEVPTADGAVALAELVADVGERFEEPETVARRIERPTVATEMKRIVEATGALPNAELARSQREAYEKTLRALEELDGLDDDEGVRAVADWVVERIADEERLPGSRDVRRRAGKICRANGYRISVDEWLGV